LRAQEEAHNLQKHNILNSEITIGSFLWLNGLRRSKIKVPGNVDGGIGYVPSKIDQE